MQRKQTLYLFTLIVTLTIWNLTLHKVLGQQEQIKAAPTNIRLAIFDPYSSCEQYNSDIVLKNIAVFNIEKDSIRRMRSLYSTSSNRKTFTAEEQKLVTEIIEKTSALEKMTDINTQREEAACRERLTSFCTDNIDLLIAKTSVRYISNNMRAILGKRDATEALKSTTNGKRNFRNIPLSISVGYVDIDQIRNTCFADLERQYIYKEINQNDSAANLQELVDAIRKLRNLCTDYNNEKSFANCLNMENAKIDKYIARLAKARGLDLVIDTNGVWWGMDFIKKHGLNITNLTIDSIKRNSK